MPYPNFSYPGYPSTIPSGTADTLGISWVTSLDEVRGHNVPFGQHIFMDRNSDIFYAKNPQGEIKAFKFQETPLPGTMQPGDYVTKQEFEDLRNKYEQLIQQQSVATTTAVSEPIIVNATDATVPGNTGTSEAGVLQQSGTDGDF